jgi:hypothetical protein
MHLKKTGEQENFVLRKTSSFFFFLLFLSSSSSSAALQPGVGFGLLYKLIPLLSISSEFLPILHLEHFHIL